MKSSVFTFKTLSVIQSVVLRLSRNPVRSEEHTSELQSHSDLVCRLLLEKKKKNNFMINNENQQLQSALALQAFPVSHNQLTLNANTGLCKGHELTSIYDQSTSKHNTPMQVLHGMNTGNKDEVRGFCFFQVRGRMTLLTAGCYYHAVLAYLYMCVFIDRQERQLLKFKAMTIKFLFDHQVYRSQKSHRRRQILLLFYNHFITMMKLSQLPKIFTSCAIHISSRHLGVHTLLIS